MLPRHTLNNDIIQFLSHSVCSISIHEQTKCEIWQETSPSSWNDIETTDIDRCVKKIK